MFVRLYLQICWRHSIFFTDFFLLCQVPLAGDSYWSNKFRRAAVTDLQVLHPIGNNDQLFL
jgi:hypothetical protein